MCSWLKQYHHQQQRLELMFVQYNIYRKRNVNCQFERFNCDYILYIMILYYFQLDHQFDSQTAYSTGLVGVCAGVPALIQEMRARTRLSNFGIDLIVEKDETKKRIMVIDVNCFPGIIDDVVLYTYLQTYHVYVVNRKFAIIIAIAITKV